MMKWNAILDSSFHSRLSSFHPCRVGENFQYGQEKESSPYLFLTLMWSSYLSLIHI